MKSTFLVSKDLICLCNKYIAACRYGISLLVFNSKSYSFDSLLSFASCRVEHSKRNSIPIRAPMHYSPDVIEMT